VFEAVHGSAPDIAGQNLANPTALIQSGVLMLEHLGQREAATRIRQGLRAVFAAGILTGDLGGSATTTAFTDALVRSIEDA
jgi:isocitrate/isopropylmalate dehydrogenase